MKRKATICSSEQNEYRRQKPQLPGFILRSVYFLFTLFRHVLKVCGIAFNLIRWVRTTCIERLQQTTYNRMLFMTAETNPQHRAEKGVSRENCKIDSPGLRRRTCRSRLRINGAAWTAPLCFRYLWACVSSPLISKTAENDHITLGKCFRVLYGTSSKGQSAVLKA